MRACVTWGLPGSVQLFPKVASLVLVATKQYLKIILPSFIHVIPRKVKLRNHDVRFLHDHLTNLPVETSGARTTTATPNTVQQEFIQR